MGGGDGELSFSLCVSVFVRRGWYLLVGDGDSSFSLVVMADETPENCLVTGDEDGVMFRDFVTAGEGGGSVFFGEPLIVFLVGELMGDSFVFFLIITGEGELLLTLLPLLAGDPLLCLLAAAPRALAAEGEGCS